MAVRHLNLCDAALEKGDDESTVEIVPFSALPKPAGAVVAVDMGGGGRSLDGDDVSDRNSGDDEEDNERFGRTGKAHHLCGREREKIEISEIGVEIFLGVFVEKLIRETVFGVGPIQKLRA